MNTDKLDTFMNTDKTVQLWIYSQTLVNCAIKDTLMNTAKLCDAGYLWEC